MKKFGTCVLSMVLFAEAHSSDASNGDAAAELKALRHQVELLEAQIKKLELKYENIAIKKAPVSSIIAPVAKPVAETKQQIVKNIDHESEIKKNNQNEQCSAPPNKKYWRLFDTSTQASLGGFLKLTGIKDISGSTGLPGDGSGAGRHYLTARTIGLEGKNGARSRDLYMNARETRFALETLSAVDGDNIHTCMELDFLGDPAGSAIVSNNYNVRLRKAYIDFKGFTIGQDWSTYADMLTFPETVDRNGPVGNCQVRQAQIRYSTNVINDFRLDVSIENPESEVIAKDGTLLSTASSASAGKEFPSNIKGENRFPDLVAAVAYKQNWGHIRLAGLLRENSIYDNEKKTNAHVIGGAMDATMLLKMQKNNATVAQFGYGSGAGRYFTETMRTASYYDGEKLHNQRAFHSSVGYKHQWEEKYNIRSTAALAYVRFLNCNALKKNLKNATIITEDKANEINKYVMSLHFNVMGNINKNTQVALEYIFGKRKTEAGLSGKLKRITFAMQVNF